MLRDDELEDSCIIFYELGNADGGYIYLWDKYVSSQFKPMT